MQLGDLSVRDKIGNKKSPLLKGINFIRRCNL